MIAFAGPCLTDFTFVIYSDDCSIYIPVFDTFKKVKVLQVA